MLKIEKHHNIKKYLEIVKNIAGQVITYILGLAVIGAVIVGCLIYALS